MPAFTYEARLSDNTKQSGEINAANETEARRLLHAQQMHIFSIQKKKSKHNFSFIGGGIGVVERIFFTQNLYIMVRTGFPLAQALKTLTEQTDNKKLRSIILELHHNVESGVTFSQSLAQFPKVFNELFTNMIAAGEVSGKLEEVLKQLTIQMKKDHSLMAKVKGALMYPVIITVAMVVIGLGLVIFILPQITGIFTASNVKLPLPTRILMGFSDGLIHYGIYVAIAGVALAFGYMRFLRTKRGKKIVHKILLHMPIMGLITKKVNIARFTRSLSSLLKTDIPIVQTFLIIEKMLGNVYYRQAMHETSEQVKEGVNIMKVMQKYPDLFPPILVQMISVGEQSGTLDMIADEIATFYEEDIDQTMTTLPSIIEPVLMILLGAAAAGLVAAIILPIYSLSDAI